MAPNRWHPLAGGTGKEASDASGSRTVYTWPVMSHRDDKAGAKEIP
ncbi:MAG: hypothetical protein KJ970_17175 [Candidatus Eisenbacteria bacterium]|uniref:Uncharacterized protein n=1 Tax=Eiseniibacteriota bacterium TaxID=2212470 RepID=A0A948W7V2_UNCEI|nr:hypothetical protein [Candidatus Eisenbacteria bacterium]